MRKPRSRKPVERRLQPFLKIPESVRTARATFLFAIRSIKMEAMEEKTYLASGLQGLLFLFREEVHRGLSFDNNFLCSAGSQAGRKRE